jgi:N-acyl-L-homoserine lactone synthetase
MSNKEHLEKYRNEVYQAYMKWKTDCKNKVKVLI